jgi:DNA-directed RNA polymerase subunit omega
VARITVEDCLDNIDNRFDLILAASKRARQLTMEGAEPLVERENDKSTVLALREIAEGYVNMNVMREED